MELDTGSAVSVLLLSKYTTMFMSSELHPTNTVLKTHSSPNDKSKYKINVAFNKVMGMEIIDGVLRADVLGPQTIEKKSENSRLWQAVSRSNWGIIVTLG